MSLYSIEVGIVKDRLNGKPIEEGTTEEALVLATFVEATPLLFGLPKEPKSNKVDLEGAVKIAWH